GMRVYAPTEIVKSKQAITTQKWQQNYYVSREINTEELKKRLYHLLNYCESTL
ncbi:MAG: MepB family protein, partial [Bacteroidetes bacterium]|nr:MepB family protein [Bacteroidota bacterium]